MVEPVDISANGDTQELRIKSDYQAKTYLLCPSDNWYMVWEKEFHNNPDYELIKPGSLGLWEDPRISIAKNLANLLLNKNWGAWGTWDIAAGHAILSAAGGVTTDFLGNKIDYTSGKNVLLQGFNSADSIERIKKLPWYGLSKKEYQNTYERS